MHILQNDIFYVSNIQIIIQIPLELVIQYIEYIWFFCVLLITQVLELQHAKHKKMSHFHNVRSLFGGGIIRLIITVEWKEL